MPLQWLTGHDDACPCKLHLRLYPSPVALGAGAGACHAGRLGAVWTGLVTLWFTWNLPNPAIAITQARRPAIRLRDESGHLVAVFGLSGAALIAAAICTGRLHRH